LVSRTSKEDIKEKEHSGRYATYKKGEKSFEKKNIIVNKQSNHQNSLK
jgi:hypothetical protein